MAAHDSSDSFRVEFLDVGQGDSILLESPIGNTMLIDSGDRYDDGEKVLNYLNKRGIDHIDHLIATHDDSDHIGGHPFVIEEFGSDRIGAVHGPKKEVTADKKTEAKIRYEDALAENGLKVNEFEEGDFIDFDGVDVDVLNPPTDVDSTKHNENSLVLHASYDKQSVLLTGDIDHETETRLVREYPEKLNHVDVLKAPHHGSGKGTGAELLMTCDPETVCFSHGENNRHNHPDDATLARTQLADTEATSTVVHGSTTFALDGAETIDIEHEREVETRDVADVTAMIHFARANGRDQLEPSEGIDCADLPEKTPPWGKEAAIITTERKSEEATEQSTETHRQDHAWVFGPSGDGTADAHGQATSSTNNKNEGL